jgi:thioredoxin 2
MASPVIACPSCGTKNRLPVVAKGHPRCASCKAALPWLVDAGDADFDEAVDTRALVVVDLWAPWCGPCRMIAPVLQKLSADLAGRVKVVKVNVDDSPRTAMRYKAQSIPMLLVMDGGQVVDTMIGAQPGPIIRSRVDGALARRPQ